MGTAAYDRGSAISRREADERCHGLDRRALAAEAHRDAWRDRAESAERDLERARRLIAVLSVSRDLSRAALAAERESHQHTRTAGAALTRALRQARRNWRRCSEVLRMLPPVTYHSLVREIP